MSTYNLTPSERRARAQSLKEQRKNRYLYSNYLAQKQEVENRAEQERLSAISDKNEKESKNFFTRSISTIGDIASNVITGAAKGLEGIVDLGAGIVGGIGGLFDKSFQDSVKSHIAYDWTGKNIGAPLQEVTKYSYIKDGGIIEGVASGIGQMLPAVAVSFATAGIGAAASGASMATSMGSTAAQMASLATLGVSAAGNSTEEAFNEGADYYKGLGYGLASGAVEVATEKMYGGATKQLFGKGVLDGVGKSVADTGIKRIAKNALKEGAEEVVAELANPALKAIYKGDEAFEKYKTADYWKGVAKAGAIGSLTAIAYSGTVGYGMSKAGMGYVGKEADINDSLAEIETQKKKADNLFANEKLTEKNEATITSNLKGNYQNIETALKKSNETKRADMIKKFSLESAFDTDGSMKAVFASKIGLVDNIEQVSEDTANDGSKALASLDKRYYTPSLRGSEQIIQKELGKITANLQENENRIALEEGRNAQQISSVTPYIGELSDMEKASFTNVKKGLNYLNGKSGSKVNIVIVNPHESFNGNLYNDTTIYLGKDTLENGKWARTLVHEYTHFTEGSKDYNKLIKFIRGDSQLFETAAQEIAKAGYMSSEALEGVIEKIEAGKELTSDEARAYGTFQSEINAHMTETLLGNENFIGKIVREDTTIAEKLLNKINDLKAMFKSFDSKESRAEYKDLEKAEKLYLKAVESAGYKYSNRKIIRTDKEELDAEGEMRYNKKTPYIQWKSDALAWANDSKRKVGDMDSGADNNYYYFYEAIAPYGDDKATDYKVIAKVRADKYELVKSWREEVKLNNERSNAGVYECVDEYESSKQKYRGNNTTTLGESSRNGQSDSLHQGASKGNGERNTQRSGSSKQGITNDDIRFSKKIATYISYSKIGNDNIDFIRKQLENLYYEIDNGIADGIAIEKDNVVYIVDSGNDNVDIRFGVRETLKIEDNELRNKILEDINERAISKGYVSDGLLEKIRRSPGNDRSVGVGRELSKELSANKGQSSNKEEGVPSSNADRGIRGLKFSRKDSEFDIPDEFFDSLILKELLDDVGDIDTNIEGDKLTKEERREAYIDKLYNEGNLNSVITKIVKDKPKMWEYFKNSKMNKKFDPLMPIKNDELVVMFHGSPNVFYSFDSNKIGKNGTLMGSGFYFTEAKEFAEGYKNNNNGKVVAALLKIEKPLSRNKNSITQTELRDFVRKVVDENGEDWLSNYGDVNNLGYEKLLDKAIKEVCKYNSNEADLIESIFLESKMNFDDFHSNLTKMLGYDGIIAWNKAEGTQAIVFKSNQIKDIFNYSPTENVDIRYSKKEGEKYYKLTEGQLKKIIANNTKYKTYTLADSEAIISNVLGNYMSFGDAYGELSGKTKKQVIDMLWKGLNSADIGYQTNVALNIADYIIQNGVLENIYGDEDSGWAVDTIYILKPYLHSLDLNGIKGEIKYKYDTDKSPYLLWGKRRGSSGIAPDQLGQLLENSGIQIDAINEADIFMQVDDLYRSAVKALKKKAKTFLTEGLSNKELKNLRQEIVREVLNGFDYTGENSKLANIVNKYTDRIRLLKEQLQDEKVRNSVINRLLDKTQKLKDLKLGTFLNATEFKNDIFKGSIEKLAAIKFRGDLNKSGTRDILKGLAEWYVESNEIVGEAYEKDIGESLNEIVNGKGKLTTKELCNLTNIVDYFKHFVETYNKVFRNGQYVEAQPIAEKYIQMLKDNKAIKVGWFNKVSGSAYERIFGDPMSVARRMDMYESGFYTEMLERLRKSTVDAAIDEMNIRAELDKFLLENKKYLKKASKKTIKYLGKDIPLMEALYVYMALGRKQAQLGLEKSGFTFTQDKETIRVNGFDTEGNTVESAQNDIFDQLNEMDKKFIEIVKKIFNEECKERKRKTDIDRRGYSNVSEDEYVPIRRANIAKNVDTSTFKEEMDRVSNASFNKDTVQGAKQELIAEPLNVVLDRHIHAIAQYANLATTIDEYNKLFSLDISGNKDKPVSVATESKNTCKDGNEYFQKLISDIQGVPASKGVGNRAMSFVRGNYAKYQLGFNPKVWLTQLSSFAAAGSILDVKSIIQGLGISSKDIDEYSPLAKLRNKNNTAAMAQGVLSKSNGKVNLTKLNDFSDLLMKPIGMVDRFVVKKLFGACQAQVEKENGLKIGTAENKQKAAELLDKVILETQQNSMATERSAAMRSGSEFMKTITMFSADAMKVVGRVIDAYGEVSALKARRKIETDPIKTAEIDKRLKVAQKKTAKSVASLVTSAVIMALIAQLFRTLYNKDDEEDDITQNMAIDAIGNLLGGLPFIRDIYSRFTQGYEISGYAYSALNDLLDTGVGIFDIVGDIFSGKADSKDIALNIKKLTYAGGQLLGLPTRNVYNIVYGLTKRFSPSVAYKVDNMFYNQKYSSNLAKAIENGDDSMIATIAGIMLNENVGEIKEAPIREEMNSLISNGFSVLPRSIGDKITYEDEEIALTNKQKEQFKKVYSGANSKVASLLNLSQYKSATEEVRAKAIKYIYDIYYNLALEDLLGVDLENKNLLFAEAIDIEKLAIIVAQAKAFTSDTDKNGKTVAGSKKAKLQAYVNALQLSAAQKYMIMGYLGYSNVKGKNQVKGYIQRLSLSKTQKEQLFEFSGCAA